MIKVLIVDDSAIVRKVLTEAISAERDLEVVGTAPDPYIAEQKILALKPDVLTLDIEMPRMDGLTFLRKLMQTRPMPVIVISSLGQAGCRAALEAVEYGAVEVLGKPAGPYSVGDLKLQLPAKIRAASVARVGMKRSGISPAPVVPLAPVRASSSNRPVIIAIGASTGGTEAIQKILVHLPKDTPPIVIAQHIPPGFSRAFADRLNTLCQIEVREAVDGDELRPGLALVAPGNFHLLVQRTLHGYRAVVKDGPLVCYQRPSVDVLFRSVAEAAGEGAIGVLLTGMGSDGAEGLLAMRKAGAQTIAEDESTCVVFGMPREAIRIGAVKRVLPLPQIAAGVVGAIHRG